MKPDQDHLTKPYLILLCHKDKKIELHLKKILEDNVNNILIKTFNNIEEIPIVEPLADLAIFDIDFRNRAKDKIGTENLYDLYRETTTPFLMFVTRENFKTLNLDILNSRPDVIHDFILEEDFIEQVFINRVKTLLSFPKLTRLYYSQKIQVQNNLWLALDYSHLFVIILNKDFKVVLANYRLSKLLGYEKEDQIIGADWTQHLADFDQDLVRHVLVETLTGNKKYEEFTNDILTLDKQRITVRWFNTLINNNFNCVFSIGVPLTKEISVDDNLESVRAYFTDIIRRDRTTINAMKEVTMKYSEKILGKKDEKGACKK